MIFQMEKNATALFEEASIEQSKHEGMVERGAVEAEYDDMRSRCEIAQSEEF